MTDQPTAPLVPETELRILLALFRLGVATARDLTTSLSETDPNIIFSTVQKLLHRLRDKGLVSTEKPSTNRLWSVVHDKFMAALEIEAAYLVRTRYLADPLMLNLVAREIERAKAEAQSTRRTGRPQLRGARR